MRSPLTRTRTLVTRLLASRFLSRTLPVCAGSLLLLAGLLGLPSPAAAAVTCDQFSCRTMHDLVPNFAGQPTIRSTRSGPWTSSSTWNLGRVPTATDIVAITGGTTVTIDGTTAVAAVIGVEAAGRLNFRNDISTRLTVGTLMLLPQGALEIGTAAAPIAAAVTAEIVIANRPLDLVDDGIGTFDPSQFGTGILSVDGKVTMFGASNTPFVRLATEPMPGNTTLSLATPVTNWRAGDRLVLPDSKHVPLTLSASYVFEGENPVVSSVSSDGLTVYLQSALLYAHPGARDGNDVLEFLPHVGNLRRNIIIRSEAPTGTRGHTFLTERSEVDIQWAMFRNMGRATIDPIDSTTFDAQGNVLHMGTNHIGRYPLHLHHVMGPVAAPASGYQFTLNGNVVDDDEMPVNRHKWPITIHASHYGLISNNVIHNAGGWGIGTEDGSESYNVFSSNFIVKVRGQGYRESTEAGHGMWFRGPNNSVRDNVIANVHGTVFGDTHGIQYYQVYLGTICVPNFPGADAHAQCTNVNGNALPLREFARNEVYGATDIGLAFWWIGSDGYSYNSAPESVVKDFRTWHFSLYGIYGYPTSKLTIDGFVVRGRKAVLSNANEFMRGLFYSDYLSNNLTIRHADIQNMRDGIMAPYFSMGTTLIEDSYLRNANNINIVTIGSPGAQPNGAMMPAKQTIIRNVTFAQVNGSVGINTQQYDIYMNYWEQFGSANLVKRDAVFVYSYNRVAGSDFQVFYNQQAPGYIMTKSNGNLVGSPVAGLTNAQNWATYGVATAGEVATNTTTMPTIYGLVRLGAPQLLPDAPTVNSVTPTTTTLSVAFTPASSGVAVVSNYQYSLDGGTTWLTRSPVSTATPLAISGLTAGTRYYVQLRAVNSNGPSVASNLVQTTTVSLVPLRVTLAPSSSSVAAGSNVTFTATATGGSAPYSYQFWVYDGTAWSVGQDWGASNVWSWCAPRGGSYTVQVWVKNAGSTAMNAWAGSSATVAKATRPTITCVAPTAPTTPAGTAVTWNASMDGGVAPYTYRFYLFDGVQWTMMRDWGTSGAWTWTPLQSGTYKIQVWARNSGSTATYDLMREAPPYLVTRPAGAVLTSVTADTAGPVPAGTSVFWTVLAAGGTKPYSYRYSVYNGTATTMVKDWSPEPFLRWQPPAAGTYTIQVWLRNAGSSAAYDSSKSSAPLVVGAPAALAVPSLTADRTMPVPAGTPVTLTAKATGGSGPYQFQFWVFNGTAWSVGRAWGPSSTWTWVPPAAGSYSVQVWVRNAGSSATYDAWRSLGSLTVSAPVPLGVPTLTMSPLSVLPVGESTVLTAKVAGGTGPHTYQFWAFNGTAWSVIRAWGTSNTFTWTPTAAGTYTIQVWIRNAGSTASQDAWQGLTPVVVIP